MMGKQAILVLDYGENQRKLNYIIKNDKYYVITTGASNKVASIKNQNEVKLDVENQVLKAKANVISNETVVKSVFDEMTAQNNNHFKTYSTSLVVVEFSL